MTGSPRRVRDRDVLLLMAGVVAVVLVLNVVSGLIPGMDRLFASAPVLIIAMVAISGLVLWRVVRRPARAQVAISWRACPGVARCRPEDARCCPSERPRRWPCRRR